MLTKTSFVTDEVYDLLNIITENPSHKGIQSDKQILETLAKLTEKID